VPVRRQDPEGQAEVGPRNALKRRVVLHFRPLLVVLRAICGREFDVEDVDEGLASYPEYVCARVCREESCATYMDYFYWVTHNNDPR